MIPLLVIALQAAAAAPAALLVRGERGTDTVAIREAASDPMLRADRLLAPLGGVVSHTPDGTIEIHVAGASMTAFDGAPFVRTGATVHPLAGSVRIIDGIAWLPLHLVSEVLPRVATGLFYDPVYLELRQFSTAALRSAPRTGTVLSQRSSRPAVPAPRPSVPAVPPRRGGRVVVIDAGHGGPDAGMSGVLPNGDRIREKDITLAVAHRLALVLRGRGFDVVMTRTTDTLIALSDRGRIANAARGDLFLSLHVNAASPRWADPAGARGFETYFLSAAKTEDDRRVEQMENEAVRYETSAPAEQGDPLSFLLADMQQNEHLRESSDLAGIVQRELAAVHPGPDRGVKQAGFRVLVSAYMPAVLIELGFGTNPAEAAFMNDPAQQRRLAESIARAAQTWLDRYERRVAGGGH